MRFVGWQRAARAHAPPSVAPHLPSPARHPAATSSPITTSPCGSPPLRHARPAAGMAAAAAAAAVAAACCLAPCSVSAWHVRLQPPPAWVHSPRPRMPHPAGCTPALTPSRPPPAHPLQEPLLQAMELLQHTDVILGMHGAGWTNGMFIKHGAVAMQASGGVAGGCAAGAALLPFCWLLPRPLGCCCAAAPCPLCQKLSLPPPPHPTPPPTPPHPSPTADVPVRLAPARQHHDPRVRALGNACPSSLCCHPWFCACLPPMTAVAWPVRRCVLSLSCTAGLALLNTALSYPAAAASPPPTPHIPLVTRLPPRPPLCCAATTTAKSCWPLSASTLSGELGGWVLVAAAAPLHSTVLPSLGTMRSSLVAYHACTLWPPCLLPPGEGSPACCPAPLLSPRRVSQRWDYAFFRRIDFNRRVK